ncbi:MAG: rhodanese-like domain-containing protein [Magnetococcales bacterium]|nr:rhodanese-like domain-containing protein [Magnetococcales bacterium]NGZ25445.1 rhodanese-like domain-containing protein [Magnetococcales bacterium]
MGMVNWKNGGWLAVGVGLTMSAMIAWAAEEQPVVPETLAGVEVVGSEQVLKLMESGGGLILDARKPDEFKAGTIPGAVNCQVSSGKPDLGDGEIDATVALFSKCEGLASADKNKPVALFCNGVQCWRSAKGSLAMKKMGYQKIMWYRMGGNDWKAKGLPME